ncbi:SurA N-terminal domain-containing protein [Actinopolymorpha cephalotaxi]|uniref:SurA N-terminal domain-containing protein n=1 Tax=Actinopolymorpha cephalotaxi TaxID=504797 RepID=A0A1I2M606_9ACTN|nr:SurA N-terminal domain-containing protein [Actinopolymorpha cephalotaxi]NYH81604.1 hypothetical protein [Actinopolymorpha cephalotaxi]SFF86912.1 SurA N-terminal domain-containing protein [Actinopolymorpha cephalotaxi]
MVGRRHAGRVAAVALVAGLALSGCGAVSNPGAAAQVGDETISVSYLQKQSRDILAKAGRSDLGDSEATKLQSDLLQQLVDDALIVPTAARAGVSASQADIDEVKSQIKAQRVVIPPDMLDGFARWVVLRRGLNTKLLGGEPSSQQEQAKADQLVAREMSKTAEQVGVKVNPRYGTWSGGAVKPGGQLVTPEPTAPEAPAQPQMP